MDDSHALGWLAHQVPGAAELIAWFGYWPSFHDAEVTSIALNRGQSSRVSVHAFEPTSNLDTEGQYEHQKHVVVTFVLDGIRQLALTDFNDQNVIFGLRLTSVEQEYKLKLEGCHGVDGLIRAESVRIEFAEGAPIGSQYLPDRLQ